MTLTIFIRCLVFILVQDVSHGGSVHGLSNRDPHSLRDGVQDQREVQWLESRDTAHENVFVSSPNSRDILDLTETEISPSKRIKRATNNSTGKTWPNDIPVVISNTYSGSVERLRRVMTYISNRACVKFHDVTNTFDKSNKTWFTSHGFQTNSYVLITDKAGCNAQIGRGTSGSVKVVDPCNDFKTNLHEMFHVLGVVHEQKGRGRDSMIAVQFGNIIKSSQKTYMERTDSDLVVNHFDPKTVMLYYDYGFNSNGLETFRFIRDDADWSDLPLSHENNLFTELNQIYKCNELFCNNNQTDCGPGYFALVFGVCRCVCPDDLDPVTNCQELINQPSRSVSWPETPMVILGIKNCPQGFDQNMGILPVTGFSKPYQDVVPFPIPTINNTLEIPICTKTSPDEPSDVDWLSWPPGGYYCIIKPKGVDCGGPFSNGSLEFSTVGGRVSVGNVGDSDVYNDSVNIQFCCQKSDFAQMPLDLPNADPFMLIAYDSCPLVRGMAMWKGAVKIYTNQTIATGTLPPKHSVTASTLVFYQCTYIPPVYGCNRDITLNSATPSVRITTPGFATAREANRRCLYGFKNPKNSRLRLTFNTIDPQSNDQFLVKRYHPWQDAYRIKNANFPKQILSIEDYLSLEYWSSWEATKHKGLDFTVDVILEEDFCYNLTMKGEDYVGDKSVAETFEDCIPWEKATSCDDFPFDDLSLLTSGNMCRNPNGKLDQPWCYTFVGETECYKRYCDVCNLKSPFDVLANCSDFIQNDPSFCTTAVQRSGCFKTCGLSQQTYTVRADESPIDALANCSSFIQNDPSYCTTAAQRSGCSMTCGLSQQTYSTRVNGCPEGWKSDGSRCFKLFTSQVTFKIANQSCKSFDPSGTLFQIRDQDDHMMVINLTNDVKDDNLQKSWISGQSNPLTKQWFFSDTDVPMTYLNFSRRNAKVAKPRKCIQINVARRASVGFWQARNCDGAFKASYICQLDQSLTVTSHSSVIDDPCQDDDVAACESAMAAFPTFCSDTRSAKAASSQCFKSCGKCTENNQCVESLKQTYNRTSPEWAVESGQVMTFSCNEDLYHVGGDLQRACSSSGDLLGQEPVCSDHPVPRDIKLETLRKRRSTIPIKTAFLMDHEDYRITFNGNITRWYYYCLNKGTLVFFVYRQDGNNLHNVGYNTISCIPGWKMSFNVPAEEQISVMDGDVFGVYSQASGTLSVSTCNTSAEKLLVLRTATANTFSDLIQSDQAFPTQYCMIPSLGLRLEP